MRNTLNRRALGVLAAAALAMPAMAEPLPDEAAVQLLQRVNELEQELRNLRGDNEKLQNELETLKSKQQENFQQVDERIDNLKEPVVDNAAADDSTDKPAPTPDKGGDADALGKSDPNGFYSYGTGKLDDKNLGVDKPIDKPATDTDKPAGTPDQPAATTTDTAEKTDTTTADKAKLPEEEERSVYDQAFQTLLQDPKEAVPEFRAFLKDYPNSSLAPSAQYWVGEALYAEKEFKSAVEEFLVVLKEHKGSDKAPDAALKLGFSFYELKEWEKARKTLEDVITFFPDNAETTKLAQERLDKMKAEGH
ncbi:tol-pal system protein YbgF [Thiothrix nivea]|uniref:Cell division coordinator CpoB n=1 Tax=Thiothrix nivea (strain ATCC 35100 / DSM 5205 / JP2) TaxID=870187 RepID=A0A656HDB1_THINJ|nr:tol-pal system protein YbgF [Thiothrix nivea]EIJ34397.1 tol-pal system protein YbgF [Thiothrix nivea DSM 5205]